VLFGCIINFVWSGRHVERSSNLAKFRQECTRTVTQWTVRTPFQTDVWEMYVLCLFMARNCTKWSRNIMCNVLRRSTRSLHKDRKINTQWASPNFRRHFFTANEEFQYYMCKLHIVQCCSCLSLDFSEAAHCTKCWSITCHTDVLKDELRNFSMWWTFNTILVYWLRVQIVYVVWYCLLYHHHRHYYV